eukprot:CAMPEP_0204821640 /NCGR_PEP_ID=MMETSP1018-20131115/39117_1 /ASSEMBLY_ACC=CAM_ASM_000518 /TAXON_ID=46462 /ORGANISM="Anophryoides haemophila, Strain AH6" /LENGTH=37 /DNA_ID= /DNA_START= /DNA_END= /DNA_ORIENTATION=
MKGGVKIMPNGGVADSLPVVFEVYHNPNYGEALIATD